MVRSCKYAFAEFTFDAASGELCRNGRRLRIPDQTAHLLALLLEADGGLITREQIRQALWPAGEHLDYDHSINKAISQLRAILRDNRLSPKFLETLPKRGYRFVKARVLTTVVTEIARADAAAVLEEESFPAPAPAPENTRSTARTHRGWLIAAVAICVLLIAGASFAYYQRYKQDAARPVRIAMAPFELSGKNDANLAESLRMDLTDAISQLPQVQMRAAHSIQDSSMSAEAVRNTARAVQAEVLIYSHLTLDDKRFILQMELIRGEDAAHIASFRYEGSRGELMSLRAKVQRDVFAHLSLNPRGEQHALGSTNNATAYEAYLRGRSQLDDRTDESLRAAYASFQQSAAADPHFSGAYAGMAHAEMILAEHEAIPAAEGYEKTRQLAQKALAETNNSAEAHALLGYSAFRLDWNFAQAERELQQAIELDPNASVYHVWYSVLLSDEGRFDESFQQIDLAHEIEPRWAPIYLTEAFLGASAHRYDRMLNAAQKLVEMMPEWGLAHDQLAWSYWFAGRYEEAVTEWRKMAVIEKDAARQKFEEQGLEVLRKGGRSAYAEMRLKACTEKFAASHGNDFIVAEWMAYAGRKDESLALLERELSRHSQYILDLPVIPAYFEYHSDPRFQRIVMRIGLPMTNAKIHS